MASATSKFLLPEPFTGSNDLECYITHFELLAHLQNWKRMEGTGTAQHEVDDRPHYFALRLQKSAIDFYRTLPEATKKSYDETVKAFRKHYNEKPVVFRGRLARRVQQPGEKLTDFLGDLQQLALKAYPEESTEIREHLVLRGFLEGIQSTQVRLDLRKTLSDAEMNVDKALERALHLEAVTRIEEEDREPRVSAVQPDLTQKLVESVGELVRALQVTDQRGRVDRGRVDRGTVDNRGRADSRSRSGYEGQRSQSFERRGRSNEGRVEERRRRDSRDTRVDQNSRYERRESPRATRTFHRSPTPGRRSRDRTPDRRGAVAFTEDMCHKCGKKGHWARECKSGHSCYECGSTQHIKKECPYLN